jgi:hypothetical protein
MEAPHTKYLLPVHHDEDTFNNVHEDKREEMLAESIQPYHKLHANQ